MYSYKTPHMWYRVLYHSPSNQGALCVVTKKKIIQSCDTEMLIIIIFTTLLSTQVGRTYPLYQSELVIWNFGTLRLLRPANKDKSCPVILRYRQPFTRERNICHNTNLAFPPIYSWTYNARINILYYVRDRQLIRISVISSVHYIHVSVWWSAQTSMYWEIFFSVLVN